MSMISGDKSEEDTSNSDEGDRFKLQRRLTRRHRRINPKFLASRPKREKVIENDFTLYENIELPIDAYNLTIAANMTKSCSPLQLNYCIKQCIFVFFLQLFIAFFFFYDYQNLDNF